MESHRTPSVSPPGGRDHIRDWVESHPYDPHWAEEREREADETRRGWLRGDAIGAYCVNRGIFEYLHALEGSAPLRDVPVDSARARWVRGRIVRTLEAWTVARLAHEVGDRSTPAFDIVP